MKIKVKRKGLAVGASTRLRRCAKCEVFYLKKYGHSCPPPKEDDNGNDTD